MILVGLIPLPIACQAAPELGTVSKQASQTIGKRRSLSFAGRSCFEITLVHLLHFYHILGLSTHDEFPKPLEIGFRLSRLDSASTERSIGSLLFDTPETSVHILCRGTDPLLHGCTSDLS